jgi:DNA-damage-inducible protein D
MCEEVIFVNNIEKYSEKTFEDIKHLTNEGIEFWYARELQLVLGYAKWEKFQNVIEKAMISCTNSNNDVSDHFLHVGKMVKAGVAPKDIGDIQLSRYACYLIVQNGDPRKEVIALGQTYFAVKTRQQELIENYDELTEEQKRLEIRNQIKIHNTSLAEAAQNAGVKTEMDYAIFQNKGYQGLYGGLGAKDVHERKGLKKSEKILDHMGSTELAANLFRATQTDEKLRRENIQGKENANKTHFEVGKKVRQTIKELGGTMPEDLPTPKTSVKQIEKKQEKKKLTE